MSPASGKRRSAAVLSRRPPPSSKRRRRAPRPGAQTHSPPPKTPSFALALLQGGGGGRRVRLHNPFDPLEMRHLAARVETRRFLTRHVAIEACITRTGAGHPLAGEEPKRSRSNRFLDLLGGRGLCHAL